MLLTGLAHAQQLERTTFCSSDLATLSADYPTANMGVCEVVTQNHFKLYLLPEDVPINPSPWYGFKVSISPQHPNVTLRITLNYGDFTHRYVPKLLLKEEPVGVGIPLGEEFVSIRSDNEVILTFTNKITQTHSSFYVSAQPIIRSYDHHKWLHKVEELWPGSQFLNLGYSHQNRKIEGLIANDQAKKIVLLLGRAHPPEVSGAFAMQAFVEQLFKRRNSACASREPSCAFFLEHEFIVVPNLNPDGVEAGHWRHNMDSTDLNRDWGKFNQPETRAVHKLLFQKLKNGDALALMLDFHSTRRNVPLHTNG